AALDDIESLDKLVAELHPQANYLATAEAVLPPDHLWVKRVKKERTEVLARVMDPKARTASGFRQQIAPKLSNLKEDYATAYLGLHQQARLGVNDDKSKIEL
ncbi:MAG: hypothetical protein GTO63_17985, partial [Anaerolineae bacterium]|nr:hypothetical protein [Anaerolineae bacterium]NIQ79335.1 hypothetical protein [Anaerolineae bacterium]